MKNVRCAHNLHNTLQFAPKAQIFVSLFAGRNDSICTKEGGSMFIIAYAFIVSTVALLGLIGKAEYAGQ